MLQEACQFGGELVAIDPFFEAAAGLPNAKRESKVDRMVDFLDQIGSWDDAPVKLKNLMERIAAFAVNQQSSTQGAGIDEDS